MGVELDRRLDQRAAGAVSKVFVPKSRLDDPDADGTLQALKSRVYTFLILMGEAVENFGGGQSRNHAITLVLIADLCWQFIRALGGIVGRDMEILRDAFPPDHEQSDQDTDDRHFARQIEIVRDAVWIFELHTFIRHPKSIGEKNLWLLSEPVSEEPAIRLVRGASGIRQVLVNVAVRLET